MKMMSINEKNEYSIEYFLKYLPEHLSKPIAFIPENIKKYIHEIRLRANSRLSVITSENNFIVDKNGQFVNFDRGVFISEKDISDMVNSFCENSYHSQADNIKNGFIITKKGYRIGVCGEYASVSGNAGSEFRLIKITSANIRISRFSEIPYNPVYDLIKKHGMKSIIIYSPPSNAKTTFIRNLSNVLSKGLFGLDKYRVALIDERKEIFIESKMSGGMLDTYFGCTKPHGIECAVRTMNPQVIICDELGSSEDMEAVLKVQNSGVPFIATTHARNFRQLFYKPNIKILIDNFVFEYAVGIKLKENLTLEYTINSFDEDFFIESCREAEFIK